MPLFRVKNDICPFCNLCDFFMTKISVTCKMSYGATLQKLKIKSKYFFLKIRNYLFLTLYVNTYNVNKLLRSGKRVKAFYLVTPPDIF